VSSNLEETLLRLEREFWQLPVADLTRRTAALEQSLMASWMNLGQSVPPTPPPNSTVSGTLTKCTTVGNGSGITVEVRNAGGTVLGTGTTTAGANGTGVFSIPVYLAANATLTITAEAFSTRWSDTVFSGLATAGGTTNYGTRALIPSSGYACSPACYEPTAKTLHLTFGTCGGIAYPNDTLTYQTTPAFLISGGFTALANVWKGAAAFTASGFNDWFYWTDGVSVRRARQGPPSQSIAISTSATLFGCVPYHRTWACPATGSTPILDVSE
jgi:hypothetical protein